jgi:putative PIN family toxin of toxin-antitoxin system
MDSGKPRAVLDAMIWARGLIARNPDGAPAQIIRAWSAGRFRVLVSGELLDEIAGTLRELGAEHEDIVQLIALLATESQVVAIQHQRMGCQDEEDDHLLETAITGKADYLVSEDRAVYDPPAHIRGYLARENVRLRRAHEFSADLDRRAKR